MHRSYPDAKEIFLNAIENYAPEDWPNYLDEACGENVGLREFVEDILDSHLEEDSILDRGEQGQRVRFSQDHFVPQQVRDETIGGQVGPYELVEILGQGGMGVVYKAKQIEPYERWVAIKLIRPEFDTDQMLTRLREERQLLAMMSHPNIATVLDGGATDQGRPYFVMELVQGVPINEFCNREKLTTLERVQLIAEVCDAIQHAHQKAVLHCDLKPSNILVSMVDGKPFPQIIDFGVARPILSSTMERDSNAVMPGIVGTPEYMSPEQISNTQDAIDTRSDVYALGALLYELVVGVPPIDPQRLRSQSWSEIRQVICEETPLPPSRRSEMLAGEFASVPSPFRFLGKCFEKADHELDSILMKAIHKDADERYASAHELSNDLRRFVAGEPVAACWQDRCYRVQKFIGGHRHALAVVALVFMLLALGLCISLWQTRSLYQHALYATHARKQALIAEQKHSVLLTKLLVEEPTPKNVTVSLLEEDSILDLLMLRDLTLVESDERIAAFISEGDAWLTQQTSLEPQSEFAKRLNLTRLRVHSSPSADLRSDLTRLSDLRRGIESISRRDELTLDWLYCQLDYQAGQFESAFAEMTRIRTLATQEFHPEDDRVLEFLGLELRRSLTLGLDEEANQRISLLLDYLKQGRFSPSKVEWVLSHYGTKVLLSRNHPDEAMDLTQRILSAHSRLAIGETAQTMNLRRQIFASACALKKWELAEQVAIQNLDLAVSRFGFSNDKTEAVRLDYAKLLVDQQRWSDARRLVEDVLGRLRSQVPVSGGLIQSSEQHLKRIQAGMNASNSVSS